MKKETFETLVGRMSKNDTTHGWDILVSYDVDRVNEFLQKNPLKLEKLSSFRGSGTAERDDGSLYTVIYEFGLELDQPILKFAGNGGKVTLTGPVRGSYTRVSPHRAAPIAFRDGYSIEYEVELKNVEGSYREQNGQTQFSPDASNDKYRSVPNNYIVSFADDKVSTRGICLSFSGAKVSLINAENAERISDSVKHAFTEGINDALKLLPSEHFIAGLTNYVTDPNMIVFQPVSFCFTVQENDIPNQNPGALLMWVAVKGGHNNGQKDSGTTQLIFTPDTDSASPIPEGSSASIIFSHDIMANQFFKPALENKNSFKDVVVKSEKGNEGLKLEGSLQSGLMEIKKLRYNDAAANRHVYEAISFPTSSPATTIQVTPGIVKAGITAVEMKFKSENISTEWATYRHTPDGLLKTGSGNIHGTFSWGAKGSWSGGNMEHPNMLQLAFEKDKHWTSNTEGEPTDLLGKIFNPKGGYNPYIDGKIEPPQPSVDLEIKALDYFLVTNLLFPGQHFFHADAPVSDGKTKGLAVPRDFILTGNVREQNK